MDKHYQLSITSKTTDINVNSVDSQEIARIVQLAGMNPVSQMPLSDPAPMVQSPIDPVAADPNDASPDGIHRDIDAEIGDGSSEISIDESEYCSICGDDDHDETSCPQSMSAESLMPLDEEVAEYDHGNKELQDEGEEVEVNDYMWNGAKLPQRIVKGGHGDNPLISELHSHLLSEYGQYLAEADRENEDGVMSPLSDATKPEFDKDPLAGETPVDDGSHSPMSTVKRQPTFK